MPVLSERSDIIVMTDEAHRSQYDQLAANMRAALPNAAFIGFTGTPLLKADKARSIIDYWQRWHISLTRFFMTTVHAPLTMAVMPSR